MLFLFTFLVSFFMAFLTQKLINTINTWFNLVSSSFFEQDHLWNLIILGVYAKRRPKCARLMIFFLTLTVRGPFHRKDFKWKKNIGVGGDFLKKRKLCIQNLTKERKQPPVVILQQAIFYNIFILWLWLRIIRRSDQGV